MRRLPLYPAAQRSKLEAEAPLPYDPVCVRCPLGNERKTVCPQPAGTGAGGTLIVVDQITADEERLGKQGVGRIHMLVAGRVHALSGRAPFMLDAAVKCHAGAEVDDKSVIACRPYLAQTYQASHPTRIIAVGPVAVDSVLGRSPHLQSVRRGYGWVWDAPWMPATTLADGRVVRPIPVFMIMPPGPAQGNAFIRDWLEADLKWAASAPTPALPPWDVDTCVIETEEDALEAAQDIAAAEDPCVTFDVETSGRMHAGELRIVSCALALHGTDVSWVWDASSLADPGARRVLEEILADPLVRKIGQSVKFDLQAIRRGLKVQVAGLAGDTRLWRKMLDSDADADLETMQELVGMGGGKEVIAAELAALVKKEQAAAQKVKGEIVKADPAIGELLKGQKDQVAILLSKYDAVLSDDVKKVLWRGWKPKAYVYADVTPDTLSRYNAIDAVSTSRVATSFEAALRSQDMMFGWDRLFGPGTEAMAQVEAWGFPVDKAQLHSLSTYFGQKLRMIEAGVFAAYPGFNPNSPKDVADLLFKQLKLRPTKTSKKTGAPSTDHESLEALRGQHPVVDGLLEYRGYAKLKSQYADGLILHVASDGCVHTTYNVDGARSGRMSSENPNMQNLPSEEKGADAKMVKKCFIARPGYILLAADYKQLEFRIAADLADDDVMRHVFVSGQDFHTATAELIAPIVWKIAANQVTKAHRRGAKTFNFGIMYGMQDAAIAARAGCDMATARAIRAAVTGKFRKFAAWIQQCLQYTRKHGVAWTYWERRKAYARQLYLIKDQDDAKKINAENSSYNTPVQGTASFYCLSSVTAMVKWILKHRIDARVVATVHDSIVLEVREDLVRMVAQKLHAVMTGWQTMTGVPLDIDMEAGYTWGTMTEALTPEAEAAGILGGPEAVAVVNADTLNPRPEA